MGDLEVQPGLAIPEAELEETASRSGGPGGQHANTSATRVTLRWSVARSEALDDRQRARLLLELDSRLTNDGDLLIHVADERSQSANRRLSRQRLAELVREALHRDPPRRRTRRTRGSEERRLRAKKRRGARKRSRARVVLEDDA